MTDDYLLRILQETERRCQEGRQSAMRDALEFLDRSTRGRCSDPSQRNAVYRVCQGLIDRSMRNLDETLEVLTVHLERDRQSEKRMRYAQNYGADSATIHRLKQDETAAFMASMLTEGPFANIAAQACKKPATLLTETTMTSIELQAQLDAALKAEALAAAAKAKDDELQYHINLAAATNALLVTVRSGASALANPVHPLAAFRKELAPLAQHYGFKIVLVGDRSKAMLVQR